MSPETQDFFRRYSIIHRVSSVANPCSKDRGELAVKSFKRIFRDYVSGSGCLDSDAITQALFGSEVLLKIFSQMMTHCVF